MSDIALRPVPPPLPPSVSKLADWQALSRDEQLARTREGLNAPDAARVSAATTADILTAARKRVAPRRA